MGSKKCDIREKYRTSKGQSCHQQACLLHAALLEVITKTMWMESS